MSDNDAINSKQEYEMKLNEVFKQPVDFCKKTHLKDYKKHAIL